MVKTARQKNCKFKSRRLTTHNSWTYGMKVLSFLTVKAMSPDLSYYAVKILIILPKCKKNKQDFPFST